MAESREYIVDEWTPDWHGPITEAELPAAYARVNGGEISWEGHTWDGQMWHDGDVIIVHAYNEWAFITLKHGDTFYSLTVSGEGGARAGDPEEEVELDLGGQGGRVKRKYLAPRELGLTVLLRAGDTPGLLTDYMWTAELRRAPDYAIERIIARPIAQSSVSGRMRNGDRRQGSDRSRSPLGSWWGCGRFG